EADLVEKVRVLQQKLDDECDLYAASREQLAGALSAAMASKARAVEEAEVAAHALEAQLQEARAVAHGRTQQHADELRAKSQAIEMLTSQLADAELARAELAHEKALLSARLADATTQVHAAKVELERLGGECQRVAMQNVALHGEVDARRKLESERDAYKLRAETLEGDIKAQLTFYENQMQQSYATIQLMQERHRHEREMLIAKVAKRRGEIARPRREKGGDAKPSSSASAAAPPADSGAAVAAEPIAKVTLNALEVLRQSEKAAEQLAKTVGF
ncbi:MAG: hypothetical protein Q8J97_09995, partial [Flavobacteriaceae bacterium]|nr:hypothetical protein [Flavobacteriaceae bacterium]